MRRQIYEVEFDITRQFDDSFGMVAVFEQRVLDGLPISCRQTSLESKVIAAQEAQVGAADELLPELGMVEKVHPDALFVYPDVVLSSYPRPQQLAEFAIKANLPMMNAFRFFTEAGGLMSYGATTSEIYTSAAEQVAKILAGARPSEVPLREATRFELVINNWTAKKAWNDNPEPSLLVRADEVIESPPPFAAH